MLEPAEGGEVADPHPVWRAVRAVPGVLARSFKVIVVGLPWHSKTEMRELQQQIQEDPGPSDKTS